MKILLVEDDKNFAQKCIEVYLSKGYEVDYAPDAVSARNLLSSESYDLITIDLMLPPTYDLEGLDLLKFLKINEYSIPAIMITSKAYKTTNIVAEAMKIGASDFIDKDETLFMERLLASIQEIDTKRKGVMGKKQKYPGTKNNPDLENLPAEAPPILKHIKWIYLHGLKDWRIVFIALLIVVSPIIISKCWQRVEKTKSVHKGDVISNNEVNIEGDYVSGDKIVNRGLSESDLEIVTRVAITHAAQLAKQYPGGYSVFGVREQGLIVPDGLVPTRTDIQWDTARVLEITDNYIEFVVPDIVVNTASIEELLVSGNMVRLAKTVDAKYSLIGLPELKVEVRVLGISKNVVVVGIGFIPKM